MTPPERVTLAITGASGTIYAVTLLRELLRSGVAVALLISAAARVVFATEMGCELPQAPQAAKARLLELLKLADVQALLTLYAVDDWFSPVASGSNCAEVMVVCPCSMGTLAAIATGQSDHLIGRAADVTLKEGKRLIVVPRESPYSEIHLRNMLRLRQMGVTILPASPGFYHQPQSLDDLVNFVVARILDQLGVPQQLISRWGEA
ncbi:MAG: UbiX family flavin prenyltransferase [Gammaproteobacteria bacterium]|nr:UbiX family flavin prenyltransferase [Gammaproteobacteria bacterium]